MGHKELRAILKGMEGALQSIQRTSMGLSIKIGRGIFGYIAVIQDDLDEIRARLYRAEKELENDEE